MKKGRDSRFGMAGDTLALSLTARGWQVTGSKLRRMALRRRGCGIDSYPLRLEPQLVQIPRTSTR